MKKIKRNRFIEAKKFVMDSFIMFHFPNCKRQKQHTEIYGEKDLQTNSFGKILMYYTRNSSMFM